MPVSASISMATKVVVAMVVMATTCFVCSPVSAQFNANDVIRMNRSNPIITANMFPSNRRSSDGNNINGPCMIRIPDWIPTNRRANSNARYYLYFGHHDGDYIRMAWSRNPTGPFTLYRAGASTGSRGVFDTNNRTIDLDEDVQIPRNHVASPNVHVDNDNRQIIMYFHAGEYRFEGRTINRQVTFVNTSDDGLSFRRRDTEPVIFGPSYMNVFEWDRDLYAFHNDGGPVRARSFNNPWRPTNGYYNGNNLPDLWERRSGNLFQDALGVSRSTRRVRHTGTRVSGNNAQVFYSIRGDNPERIYVSNIRLSSNWNNWNVNAPGNELLRAVGGWEGGHLRSRASEGGAATGVNELRDPYPFQDRDGSLYLYYAGQGEDAIGVAAMESNRQNVRTRGARHDAETRQGSDSNRNFRSSGTATTRRGSGTNDRRFYLRFDSPGGGTVQAAVLRLYLPNNESGDLEVFATTNFTEGNIRGNNRPSQGSRIDRIPLGQRGFYEFDVTNYVNDNRNRDINFVVRARGTNAVQILTSETGNSSRRPQLKWMQRR